ncbi:hypothetical protein NHX12_009334 [Muraenolepis orangiensis]|uniref:Tetratricopeptide repeat protein 36 n=1 Tax=Muraenolepis orangiensis TaxID=630683 RepID=A0A9Q0DN42_9TELE|nr:hypothetical protein NHX12_009334 [Muraenolepis orangiensis]
MSTEHDRAVLQAIFNPSCPLGDADPTVSPEVEVEDDDKGFEATRLTEVKALEAQGVSAAEGGDLEAALHHLNKAILLLPTRASAYNNRAQALRLQGNTAGALADLDLAVTLSNGSGLTGRQALVQRGLLLRLAQRDADARADFERAAALGSEFARHQAVALNPYAALCNRMLTEVLHQLRNPEVSHSCE